MVLHLSLNIFPYLAACQAATIPKNTISTTPSTLRASPIEELEFVIVLRSGSHEKNGTEERLFGCEAKRSSDKTSQNSNLETRESGLSLNLARDGIWKRLWASLTRVRRQHPMVKAGNSHSDSKSTHPSSVTMLAEGNRWDEFGYDDKRTVGVALSHYVWFTSLPALFGAVSS